MQKVKMNFLMVMILVFGSLVFGAPAQAGQITNKVMSYFNGAILLTLNGKVESTQANIIADVTDAQGKPYPAITAKWVAATVEMVTMDMGISKVKVTDDQPAKIKLQPTFSMSGQWKLNIKLTTAAGTETKSITFDVP